METLFKDVRYGIRSLLKRPGFTAIAVITLALGIGANTAIFTVVEAALLRSLPYRDAERLVHLWESNRQQEFKQREASYPDYVDWQAQNHVFAAMGGYSGTSFTLTGQRESERFQAALVTASFFSVLGIQPASGRAFRPEDDRPGAPRVVILSDSLWRRRFGADSQLVGQIITLNGDDYTVVGILPAQFQFAPLGASELWVPDRPTGERLTRRAFHWLNVIARLKPGVSFNQAQADMDAMARRLEQEQAASHTGIGIKLVTLSDQIVGPVKPILLVLLGAVGFVLLIACTNVANLLLARALTQQKEIAIRLALGANRFRLIRQLLAESILLALLGGVVGLVWAQWGVDLLIAAIPEALLNSMPYLRGLTIDGGVLGFTIAVSLLTVIIFGLAPALQASKPDVHEALKESGRSSHSTDRHQLRHLLVISEIALALVLLVGAGLMLRSLHRLLEVDSGFKPDHLLTLRLSLSQTKYPKLDQVAAFHEQLLTRIGALPGVQGVGTTSTLPLIGGGTLHFLVEDEPAPAQGEEYEANTRDVSVGYFRALGVPLLKGRDFTAHDNTSAPNVVVINQTLASRLFPNQDPTGQRLIFPLDPAQRYQIVGVVGDIKESGLDARTTPVIYGPFLQSPDHSMSLVVRTATDPDRLVSAVRNEIQGLDAELPLYRVTTMEQLIASMPSTFTRRYPALLIGIFAVVALVMAIIGLYGVMSYAVTQRSQEIGLRMALGAQMKDVMKLVLRNGMTLALLGVAIGLAGALALTRLMRSLLFGVTPTDPVTFGFVAGGLLVVALVACYLPARRATKVDPLVALRYE